MTPEELVELFRLAVDDTDANDPLWSSLEAYSYLDEAQKQFARKTDYFSDASTPNIVQAPITANDPWVSISPRITRLRSAQLASSAGRLAFVTLAEMEVETSPAGGYPSPLGASTDYQWMRATGTPVFAITDMERDKLRLVNIPTVADTLVLSVYRLPLLDITEESAALEIIETDYQRGLLFYMKHLAYSKNDVDTYQQALADRALAEANSFYIEAHRAVRRKLFSPHVGVVRYGGL